MSNLTSERVSKWSTFSPTEDDVLLWNYASCNSNAYLLAEKFAGRDVAAVKQHMNTKSFLHLLNEHGTPLMCIPLIF